MKAILVIDMSDNCYECQLRSVDICCGTSDHKFLKFGRCSSKGGKPKQCPLRPMPERNEEVYADLLDAQWKDGYNTCLDRIMGETE